MAKRSRSTKVLGSGSRFSRSQVAIVAGLTAIVGTAVLLASLASSSVPTLSLNPVATTVKQGDLVTVNVMLNPAGQVISAVGLKIDYDPLQLQLVSTTYPSSTGVPTQATQATGLLILTPPTIIGSQTPKVVEVATFKALTGGSATLSLDSTSHVYNTGVALVETISKSVVITVTLPAVPPVTVPPITLPPVPPVVPPLPPVVPPGVLPPPPPPAVNPPVAPPATQPTTSGSSSTKSLASSSSVKGSATTAPPPPPPAVTAAAPKQTWWDKIKAHPVEATAAAVALLSLIVLGIKLLPARFKFWKRASVM